MKRSAVALLPALCTAACAHAPRPAPAPPLIAEPANARVRLYAACAEAASRAGTVERYAGYVRFTCSSGEAQAMFDAMDAYASARGLTKHGPGLRVTRTISPRDWDDQCVSTSSGVDGLAVVDYVCVLHLPVGDFLYPERDLKPSKPPK